jgi:ABC-type lipoprotein export system ATPase subunit
MHPEQVVDRVQPDPLCLCRVHADHHVKHQAVDKRVSIARAMVNHPDILFADEPCANSGSENSTMVLDLFKEINEQMHQTIVMVSHEDWHKKISTGSSSCATGVSIRRGYSKEKTG